MSLLGRFAHAHPHGRRNRIIAFFVAALVVILIIVLPPAIVLSRPKGDRGHSSNRPIEVPATARAAGPAVRPSFLSYSIEFASLPDFAGSESNPNPFTANLLANIEARQRSKSHIRVGGNTQDFALLEQSLDRPTNASFVSWKADGFPTVLHVGPSYYDRYTAFPTGTRFIHGFNLAHNSSSARQKLMQSVPYACKALSSGRLLSWEIGNEPDLYRRPGQDRGVVRPSWWNEPDFAREWLDLSRDIRDKISDSCPGMASDSAYKLVAPSFAAPRGNMNLITSMKAGLNDDGTVNEITAHNYIDAATSPGVTIQNTLLSHGKTVESVRPHVDTIRQLGSDMPYVLGEANSVYNRAGTGPFADSFGAALWHVDFALWCAAVGIARIHLHQGTDFPYGLWQPIDTNTARRTTRPAYYGNIATAAMLGNLPNSTVQIANLVLDRDDEAAYVAYVNDRPARLMVVNLVQHNQTGSGRRQKEVYEFELPVDGCGSSDATLRRLVAAGTDATTGVTFDGYSFDYAVNKGLPTRDMRWSEETARVNSNGRIRISVPVSSGVMVELSCGGQ